MKGEYIMKFYVYEWYNINTKEVFYVGKVVKKDIKQKAKEIKNLLNILKITKSIQE